MDEEGITVTDNNLRFPIDERLKAEMRAHDEEIMRMAEEREERLLNKPSLVDALMNGVDRVKALIKRKKVMAQAKAKESERQH